MIHKISPLILVGFVGTSSAFAQIQTITNWATGPSPTNQFSLTNGYIAGGSSLDGQPTNAPSSQQWQTTDVYNPTNGLGSSSSLDFLGGWTAGLPSNLGGNNNSVRFGGFGVELNAYMPGITNPLLYRTFDSVLITSQDTVSFSMDFSLIGPSSTLSGFFTNRDFFSINLRESTGTNSLAKIVFNPFTTNYSGNAFRPQWVQNGTNVVANGTTYTAIDFTNNALWRLNATISNNLIDLSLSGLIPQSGVGVGITNYLVTNTFNVISGGALSTGLTAANFERLDIGWELSSGSISAPGANYMIINGMSVISQVIPEPGTWAAAAIMLIGGSAVALRRRRQVKVEA